MATPILPPLRAAIHCRCCGRPLPEPRSNDARVFACSCGQRTLADDLYANSEAIALSLETDTPPSVARVLVDTLLDYAADWDARVAIRRYLKVATV